MYAKHNSIALTPVADCTRVVRRRDGKLISDGFLDCGIVTALQRYVVGFGYSETDRVDHTIYLARVR